MATITTNKYLSGKQISHLISKFSDVFASVNELKELTNILKGNNGIKTTNSPEIGFGKYNQTNDNQIFSVGIGDRENRKNALSILGDGTVYFGENKYTPNVIDVSYIDLCGLIAKSAIIPGQIYYIRNFSTTVSTSYLSARAIDNTINILTIGVTTDSITEDCIAILNSEVYQIKFDPLGNYEHGWTGTREDPLHPKGFWDGGIGYFERDPDNDDPAENEYAWKHVGYYYGGGTPYMPDGWTESDQYPGYYVSDSEYIEEGSTIYNARGYKSYGSTVHDITVYQVFPGETTSGVIYWMKDQYGNEAPYDFMNIEFMFDSNWYKTFYSEKGDGWFKGCVIKEDRGSNDLPYVALINSLDLPCCNLTVMPRVANTKISVDDIVSYESCYTIAKRTDGQVVKYCEADLFNN